MEERPADDASHLDDVRRRRILWCATEAFLANGFAGASVEDIAIEAGVSKPTIYRVFADKLGLAMAVLADMANTLESACRATIDFDASPEDCLVKFGENYVRWMNESTIRTPNYAILKLMMELSSTHPDVAQVWKEASTRAVVLPLAEYLESRIERGEITGESSFFLAAQFAGSVFSSSQAIVAKNAYNSDLALMRRKARLFLQGCAYEG